LEKGERMPKPIKKKPEKKGKVEEVGMNYVESVKDVYARNQQIIQKTVLGLIVLIIVVAVVFFYMKRTRSKVTELNYEGYKAYSQAIATDDKTLFNQALEKFKESYNVKRSAYALYYQADIDIRTGNTDEAITLLTSLISTFSVDNTIVPLAYVKLGTLYLSKNDNEKALKTFQEMRSRNIPVYGDLALYYESSIQKKIGNTEEAKEAMKQLVDNYPNSPYTQEVRPQLEAEEKTEAAAETPEKEKEAVKGAPAK